MSHGDTISTLPSNFEVIASTKDVKIAAYKNEKEATYAIKFQKEE
jgi:GMP synthase (glutamine-hydrolysing)